MVLRNTVLTVFRIFSAVKFQKPLRYRMGYIVIFNRLAGTPNVALLEPLMVQLHSIVVVVVVVVALGTD